MKEGTTRRKVVVVLDLETENKYELHNSDLASAVHGVLDDGGYRDDGVGRVHDIIVFEKGEDETFIDLLETIRKEAEKKIDPLLI